MDQRPMDQRFVRDIRSLESIFAFVDAFVAANGILETHAFEIKLVLEELFTNMVKYNQAGLPEIPIRLQWVAPDLTMTMEDSGGEPFDVTAAPAVDIHRRVREGGRGGLGLHLVRQIADSLDWYRQEGRSTITVRKRLGS